MWLSRDQMPVPEGIDPAKKPLSFKSGGLRWILVAAVAKKTAIPVSP
jgi:hypothetical protein